MAVAGRQAGRPGAGRARARGQGRGSRGFTLVELLFALAITGLLVGYVVPSLQGMMLRARVTATANDLLGLVEGGRTLAQVRHVPVTVCPVDKGQCGEGWRGNVMLFVDINGNGAREEGEEVLQDADVLAGGLWLVWKPFRATPYLTWTSNGQASAMNGTFTLCNEERRSDLLRQVVISRAGRVRLFRPRAATAVAAARGACGW